MYARVAGVGLLHLYQMRASEAFKSFYYNPSNARKAVDRMFTHPDWGFAYPDQDIHTALALLHPVRPWHGGLKYLTELIAEDGAVHVRRRASSIHSRSPLTLEVAGCRRSSM